MRKFQIEASALANDLARAHALIELAETLNTPPGLEAVAHSGLSESSILEVLEMAEEILSKVPARLQTLAESWTDAEVQGELYEARFSVKRGYAVLDILSTLATEKGITAGSYSGLSEKSISISYEVANKSICRASDTLQSLLK